VPTRQKNTFSIPTKEIFIFIAILVGLLLLEFIVLKSRQDRYSAERLETMITSQSDLRDTTDDPCKYPILGDPEVAEGQYIKLRISCADGRELLSTMDPRAIKGTAIQDTLLEFARVAGFALVIEESGPVSGRPDQRQYQWSCRLGVGLINDYQEELNYPAEINCRLTPYEQN
jgi:hypothetical protein